MLLNGAAVSACSLSIHIWIEDDYNNLFLIRSKLTEELSSIWILDNKFKKSSVF